MVKIEDVIMMPEGDIEVDFNHIKKSRARGFTFMIPGWLDAPFKRYLSQLPKPPVAEASDMDMAACRDLNFMRNHYGKNSSEREQNMGKATMRKHLRRSEELFELVSMSLTGHVWRLWWRQY